MSVSSLKVLLVYYSMYGHVYRMIQAAAEGVQRVTGVEAVIRRVPETLPVEVIEKMGAVQSQKEQEVIPVCSLNELSEVHAVIFGTPTRFGNMCGQMRQFLDSTGKLWQKGALVGKVGSVITSSNTQHGGQESTILSFHITLLHHGMVIAGLPYTFSAQMTSKEVTGCSPYGASTIAGEDGRRMPSENELAGARFQGEYVANLTARLWG